MNYINLCPHTINVCDSNGVVHAIPPSGEVARVSATTDIVENEPFKISKQIFGDVTGLPEVKFGYRYIVSGIVLAAVKGKRYDVVAPDTGPSQVRFTVEDEAAGLGKVGQTKYVTGFVY